MSTNDNDGFRRLLGAAKVILGGAFVYEGLKLAFGQPRPSMFVNGLGRTALPDNSGLPGSIIRRATERSVGDIDERVAYIHEMLNKSSLDPKTREVALGVLGRKCGDKWCVPEKNYLAEVRALFQHTRKNVRYVKDHVEVDQFQHRRVTGALHGGDCDDQVIYLGSLLKTVGYPVRLRIVHTTDSSTWNHIYLMVGLPPHAPDRWMALDTTEPFAAGWQVPGADEAKLSGRVAGIVKRVKDYSV